MKKSSLNPTILITSFGILMGVLSLYFMVDKEAEKIRSRTIAKAHDLKDAIESEFLRSENVLRGIEGLIHSSEVVTRKEFEIFCANAIDEEIPLHLVEWQPKVPREEREKFEKMGKESGVKDFQFFEINEKGKEIPAKDREFHFPVYYSYSPKPANQAVGLDLAFSPVRMNSKYESMKIGRPVASGTFEVIVKDSPQRDQGFALTYPVFNDPTISSSQTLKHLKGFIAIVLYLDEFFKPVVDIDNSNDFQFEIQDVGEKNKVVFKTLIEKEFVSRFASKIRIDIGNRNWDLYVYPTSRFVGQEMTFLPWIIFILIVMISFGLGSYLFFKTKDQEKLNKYLKHIQQKQKLESVGILASGIAHEFNNILQCITLANENLKITKLDDIKKENIETSLEYCQRGRALVKQILSFARQDSGIYKELMPSEEIRKTLKLIKSSLSQDIEFKLDIDEENDTPFYMNVNHLSQILINLCNNAAHAMNNEGLIEISYKIKEEKRILSVRDNGVGIGEEVLEKIFDPFFSTKSVNEGTGLGLSVIYGIVKSYDGEILVNSALGRGSEFKIVFPLT